MTRSERLQPTTKEPVPSARLRRVRAIAGLTQAQAADVIGVSERAWQQWEAGERQMQRAFYELFMLKVGLAVLVPGKHGLKVQFAKLPRRGRETEEFQRTRGGRGSGVGADEVG